MLASFKTTHYNTKKTNITNMKSDAFAINNSNQVSVINETEIVAMPVIKFYTKSIEGIISMNLLNVRMKKYVI